MANSLSDSAPAPCRPATPYTNRNGPDRQTSPRIVAPSRPRPVRVHAAAFSGEQSQITGGGVVEVGAEVEGVLPGGAGGGVAVGENLPGVGLADRVVDGPEHGVGVVL
jgi:hypothetical protein